MVKKSNSILEENNHVFGLEELDSCVRGAAARLVSKS